MQDGKPRKESIRSPVHADLGEAIREIRRDQGRSQARLAAACELDRTYVGGIERGTRNPSLANIVKIATALDVLPVDLLLRAERIKRERSRRAP